MSSKTLFDEIGQGMLTTATLSSPRKKSAEVLRLTIRPVAIRSKLAYQVSEHYPQKAIHRNLKPKECVEYIQEAFKDYRQGVFFMESASYHVLVNKRGQMKVIKKNEEGKKEPPLHNRPKNYLLQEGVSIPFLAALGMMTPEGKIVAKKYDKFRQVNRFLEMVDDIFEHLPKNRCLRVVDIGCGKASLTFALYHYLHGIKKLKVNMTGFDLKREVVVQCQALARELKWEGLKFAVADINEVHLDETVDLVVSLHACDTATDAALEKAVRWGAKVILAAPCCQHELYSQVRSEAMASLLRHGILRERFAALATDAARAELLEAKGYGVQILEFIDMEHTPKNIMLRAIKGTVESKQRQAKERYRCFKQALQITPSLDNCL